MASIIEMLSHLLVQSHKETVRLLPFRFLHDRLQQVGLSITN